MSNSGHTVNLYYWGWLRDCKTLTKVAFCNDDTQFQAKILFGANLEFFFDIHSEGVYSEGIYSEGLLKQGILSDSRLQ